MKQYAEIRYENLVCGLIYIDRLLALHPIIKLNYHTVHRLILIGTLLAAKFGEDAHFNNLHWSKVGGIGLSGMCHLLIFFMYIYVIIFHQYIYYLSIHLLLINTSIY